LRDDNGFRRDCGVTCSAFEPIRWSSKDTDDTIRQAKEHNAVWASICAQQR
jgi:hypothetical protein